MNINIPSIDIRNTVRKGLAKADAMLVPKQPSLGQRVNDKLDSIECSDAKADFYDAIDTAIDNA